MSLATRNGLEIKDEKLKVERQVVSHQNIKEETNSNEFNHNLNFISLKYISTTNNIPLQTRDGILQFSKDVSLGNHC